jgi:hypothetical protein
MKTAMANPVTDINSRKKILNLSVSTEKCIARTTISTIRMLRKIRE